MTMVVTWPDGNAQKHPGWDRLIRRLSVSSRLWARRHARRRFASRILAETRDPRILADLGMGPVRPRHVERWIMAMLYHQH
jgi:hypothetical protein